VAGSFAMTGSGQAVDGQQQQRRAVAVSPQAVAELRAQFERRHNHRIARCERFERCCCFSRF
jgi:hypothetical protein